jgi:hypothetical protein
LENSFKSLNYSIFDVGWNVLKHEKVYYVHGNDWRVGFDHVCYFDFLSILEVQTYTSSKNKIKITDHQNILHNKHHYSYINKNHELIFKKYQVH